jgi:hypothetical protein
MCGQTRTGIMFLYKLIKTNMSRAKSYQNLHQSISRIPKYHKLNVKVSKDMEERKQTKISVEYDPIISEFIINSVYRESRDTRDIIMQYATRVFC